MRLPTASHSAPWLLAAVTAAAWCGAIGGVFQYDDFAGVVRDEATVDASELFARLGTGIRPLLRLSYFLDHLLWGMRPEGFLLTNVLLHIGTVLGVHALGKRLLRDEWAAFLAAAIFALQPAHAEVICYVSGRSTGLMAALFVWGFVAWETERRRTALALFVAACLAKEVALVFPLFLAVREMARPREERRITPGVVALGVSVAVAALFALSPRYRDLLDFSLALRSPLENLGPAIRGAAVMVSLWVRPWALSVDHAPPSDGAWLTALALSGACALAAGALLLRRRDPVASLCLAWPLLALLPTCSLIAKLDLVTEKPLYLAWVGPAILAGRGLGALASRAPARIGAPALAGVALCVLAAWIPARVYVWSDAKILWADAAGKNPLSARSWNNLGHALWVDGHDDTAAFAFERATILDSGESPARWTRMLLQTRGTR